MIDAEEQDGVYNQDPHSTINLLIKLSKEISGSSNFVFKALSLLIKSHENCRNFRQNFLDFYPVATIEKSMDEYMFEVKETIALSSVRILAAAIKVDWLESQ